MQLYHHHGGLDWFLYRLNITQLKFGVVQCEPAREAVGHPRSPAHSRVFASLCPHAIGDLSAFRLRTRENRFTLFATSASSTFFEARYGPVPRSTSPSSQPMLRRPLRAAASQAASRRSESCSRMPEALQRRLQPDSSTASRSTVIAITHHSRR